MTETTKIKQFKYELNQILSLQERVIDKQIRLWDFADSYKNFIDKWEPKEEDATN